MNELSKELNIETMIYEIRGKQVMLDSDVAVNVSKKIIYAFISLFSFINFLIDIKA